MKNLQTELGQIEVTVRCARRRGAQRRRDVRVRWTGSLTTAGGKTFIARGVMVRSPRGSRSAEVWGPSSAGTGTTEPADRSEQREMQNSVAAALTEGLPFDDPEIQAAAAEADEDRADEIHDAIAGLRAEIAELREELEGIESL